MGIANPIYIAFGLPHTLICPEIRKSKGAKGLTRLTLCFYFICRQYWLDEIKRFNLESFKFLIELIEKLKHWDNQLFLFLNGKHNEFWDFIMYWTSDKLIWIPLYLFFLYLIIRHYRKGYAWIIVTAVIMIIVSDQLSVHAFKNVFQRLRPCHEPAIEGLVHLVRNKCGGNYGFVSSHAVNHFAMAVFFSVIFFKKIRYFIPVILFWAAFVSYSRIYLGVHYPGDVIAGGFVGSILGFLFGKLGRSL